MNPTEAYLINGMWRKNGSSGYKAMKRKKRNGGLLIEKKEESGDRSSKLRVKN